MCFNHKLNGATDFFESINQVSENESFIGTELIDPTNVT